MQFVGFDPGGKDAFGWAVLESTPQSLNLLTSGTCTGAQVAFDQVKAKLKDNPIGVGVDAPLFWTHAGDRNADVHVRNLVLAAHGHAGTVNHVNSLRGACLVQGVLIASLSRVAWPNAKITEAHPKALSRVSVSAHDFISLSQFAPLPDHERDAVLAAYAAHQFAIQSLNGWCDLVTQETSPFFPAGRPIAYWFPQQ